MLFCIIIILAAAYFFTKHVVGRNKLSIAGFKNDKNARVLLRLQLSRDSRILLVKIGPRFFLLGQTASEISMLAEFTKEEAEEFLQSNDSGTTAAQAGFGQVMQTFLKQRTKG